MPFPSEPNCRPPDDVTARCPVCEQNTLTIVAELPSSVFFRCESCGFIWMEDKPQVPDQPRDRVN
jgi:DNA-directed RNA polymerase subunit M/transcription elongation factor TFIIS